MKDQEAFDIVVNHLKTQKQRSFFPYSGNTCAYRGPNGLKCAVGALIPDYLYSEDMDLMPMSVGKLLKTFPKLGKFFEGVNKLLLLELQNIHDKEENWDETGFNGFDELKQLALEAALEYKNE